MEVDWDEVRRTLDEVKASGDPLGLGRDPEISKILLKISRERMERNPEDPKAKEHYEALHREVKEWWGKSPEDL